jgi:hypothetical protein
MASPLRAKAQSRTTIAVPTMTSGTIWQTR